MSDEYQVKSVVDIKKILAEISFAPSCVDMGWEWEVKLINEDVGYSTRECGYLIRTTFRRPERDTGKIGKGFGRYWHIPDKTTVSGVVKTAYAAALMILQHELQESFKWQGKRVFDPHNSVEALASLSTKG
jgi:hypothetical protein